jgi:hypothetical protein
MPPPDKSASPYWTMGEASRLLKNSGLNLRMVICALLKHADLHVQSEPWR